MTRPIKFNYWDGEKMVRADIIHICEVDGKITSRAWDGDLHEYFDLIEFTGLLDKNGKEIYEGDIVRNQNGAMGTYIWNPRRSGWDIDYKMFPGFETLNEWEITGNIYENPNLLK